jgi:hypothetical protein
MFTIACMGCSRGPTRRPIIPITDQRSMSEFAVGNS